MDDQPFLPHEIVILRSTGQEMNVIECENGHVRCWWLNKDTGMTETGLFPVHLVKLQE